MSKLQEKITLIKAEARKNGIEVGTKCANGVLETIEKAFLEEGRKKVWLFLKDIHYAIHVLECPGRFWIVAPMPQYVTKAAEDAFCEGFQEAYLDVFRREDITFQYDGIEYSAVVEM